MNGWCFGAGLHELPESPDCKEKDYLPELDGFWSTGLLLQL